MGQHAIKQSKTIDRFGAAVCVCVYIACTGNLNKTIRNEADRERECPNEWNRTNDVRPSIVY